MCRRARPIGSMRPPPLTRWLPAPGLRFPSRRPPPGFRRPWPGRSRRRRRRRRRSRAIFSESQPFLGPRRPRAPRTPATLSHTLRGASGPWEGLVVSFKPPSPGECMFRALMVYTLLRWGGGIRRSCGLSEGASSLLGTSRDGGSLTVDFASDIEGPRPKPSLPLVSTYLGARQRSICA